MLIFLPLTPSKLLVAPYRSPFALQARDFSNEIIYEVNGERKTKSEVLLVAPEERSQSDWLVLVDWTQVRSRPYVIIDPFDPAGLLYLNYAEYLIQTRTLASAAISLTIIYRPGVVKPIPLPKVPPHPKLSFWMDGDRTYGIPVAKLPFISFSNLKQWLARNFTWSRDGTVRVNDRNVRGFLTLWAREAGHLLGLGSSVGREVALQPIIAYLERSLKNESPLQTIKRMKISVFCILSYIAGTKLKDTQELGLRVRLTNGLPVALGLRARNHIRRGSPQAIRFWTSLLVAYKAMDADNSADIPDLSTITAESGSSIPIGDFAEFCSSTKGFWSLWEEAHKTNYKSGKLPAFQYKSSYGKPIITGGANNRIAVAGAEADAYAWSCAPRNYAMELFSAFGDTKLVALMQLMATNYLAAELGKTDGLRALVVRYIKQNNYFVNGWSHILTYLETTQFTRDFSLSRALSGITPGKTFFHRGERVPDQDHFHLKTSRAWIQILMGEFFTALGNSFNTNIGDYFGPPKRSRIASYLRFGHKAGYPILGRLHAIYEAAGKIRVVAICDYFTQLACESIHTYIFTLLRGCPQDGTFDQQAAVESFAKLGFKDIFSYDLKSATDLIPIELYREVLTPLFGRKIVDLWSNLLTDRWFWAPFENQAGGEASKHCTEIRTECADGGSISSNFIKYKRGQPMGALSSWGSMALVHHAMVQYAASPYFDIWFTAYRVLGDDIIIADTRVAAEYVKLCERYGIVLSLAKSLISKKGVFNFASQTYDGNDNMSTVSLKEVLSASTWDRRLALALRVLRISGDNLNMAGILRRVCTFPMWQSISSELTHGVKSGGHRFVNFILHNPFTGGKPWDGPYIDSIVSWLGSVAPKMDTMSSFQTSQFETDLRRRTFRSLMERAEKDLVELDKALKRLAADRVAYLSHKGPIALIQGLYIMEIVENKLLQQKAALLKILKEEFPIKGKKLPTQRILQLWIELGSIVTLPKTWDGGVDRKVPWADILKGIGEMEQQLELEKSKARSDLFKATGTYIREFPKDKLLIPYKAILESVLEITGTIVPIPRPLRRLPKGFSEALYQRFLDLRREQLRQSWLAQVPGALTMNVTPYLARELSLTKVVLPED